MDGGWSQTGSPFHAGEQEAQERLGLRDRIEAIGRRVIRDYLPQQHRDFYGELPFVLIGSVDGRGRPWASLLAGQPGFMTSPDPQRLAIAARPLPGDPLAENLEAGAEVGLLGLQPETRRRNRLTGRVEHDGPEGTVIRVRQTFGNCPQYIQARAVTPRPTSAGAAAPVHRAERFDAEARRMIETADTLFIATSSGADAAGAVGGADVSHRGGKPGFVRVEDDRSFVFPDFSGNNHFNSVGNILLNPRAGFLFVDFAAGDLLYLTGTAEIVWEGAGVQAFAGAERLIRFRAEAVVRAEGSLPLAFDFHEASPLLAATGSWAAADEAVAQARDAERYRPFEVDEVVPESGEITSFYLKPADGGGLADYEAGQFLPIRVQVPGREAPALRTYTLSQAPGGARYRLSVKREGGEALVSPFLHDRVQPGFRLEAMAPRGQFTLDRASDRPAVLLSGGVGITPMIAMAEVLAREGRQVHFIHGARNGRAQAFGARVRALAAAHPGVSAHIRYSAPAPGDRLGESHDSEGHVDLALLKGLLGFDDYDFYLCGPAAFMRALYDGLTELGVREARIHYESFGPATVLRHEPAPEAAAAAPAVASGPVPVRFAAAEIEATWSPERGTLLDLAEAAGLAPDWSCRSGICGTCATRLKAGAVDYLEAPSAPRGEDEVLICCATPRPDPDGSCRGEDCGVVLDL